MPQLVAATLPSGPAYTVVLLCHVAAVLVGMVTMVAGAAFSLRLLAAGDGPVPPSVRSYFSPGTNWVGRVLYLVPVLGAALLAMSGGAYRVGSDWVLTGIGLWVTAIGLAEAVLWPAEQRVRRVLGGSVPAATTAAVTSSADATAAVTSSADATAAATRSADVATPAGAAGDPPVVTAAPGREPSGAVLRVSAAARQAARTMCLSSLAVLALLAAGTAVMLAKP